MGWINEQEATALAFVVLTVTLMALGARRVPTERTCCLLSELSGPQEVLRLVGCELQQ